MSTSIRKHQTLQAQSFDQPISLVDPLWAEVLRIFQEANEARRVHQSRTVEGVVVVAKLYLREQTRWEEFLAERGVRHPRRGPMPSSKFHGLAKFVLGLDRDDGSASRLAQILDEWQAARPKVPPEKIPQWVAGQGRITRLYQRGEGVPGTYLSKNARWRAHPKPIYRVDELFDPTRPKSTTEWLTPGELFAAMQVKKFDMDVCSPGAEFVPWIPARVHLTKNENGLVVPWKGFVWCNPPFGMPGIMDWINKFIAHRNGVMLVPDFTPARWYQFLISHADAVLHVCPKIQFLPKGDRGNALGSSLVAIGELGVRALENAERNGRGVCLYRRASGA